MRIRHKSALFLILLTPWYLTLPAQELSASQPWESNPNITGLPKIELGTWQVPDTVKNQWTDKNGNSTFHNFPPCFLLDLKEGTDVTTGKGYVLRDMAEMFGPDGLLKDRNDNFVRLMESPLMTPARLVYEAKGGPVDVDFMFGSGGFGNRLCYFYLPAGTKGTKSALEIAQDLSNNLIPTFCITDQMRTSVHMERYKKEGGEWKMLPKGKDEGQFEFTNSDLGDRLASDNNYGGWGDDMITGKRFHLKYFGPNYDQAPSDEFPAGTQIYFFLATYNDYNWNGGTGDERPLPFSVKFAYRELNDEFGNQGKWDYLNCPEHKTKQDRYGAGIIAAAAVNFTYTDSDKGSLENIDFMTWEDWTQPVFGEGRKVGDFDMGDVGFGIYGVKNPIFDAISDSNVGLKVVQEVKDFQDSFNVSGKGSLANAYRYKFMLENGTDGKNLVYSRALQPVTFTRFNETTGEGRFEPSYTWVTVYRFSDDSEVADEECCMVIRKTASLPDGRAPKVEDLNNPDLVYRLDYAMTEAYAEQRLPQVWDGKWKFDDGEKLFFEYSRGENNDNTPLPLERMTSIYHDVTETLNPENEYVDSKRFWMVFAFRDGIRVPTDEDGVASPRAQIVIEPRGTVDHIDLQDEEVKHMKSYDSLMPIDNRTYFTISYNPRANLFGKEHISALFIVNNEGARFCKIIYKEDTDTWETMAESTDHPDNQDRLYEIVDVIDESETMRHILLATNLAVDKNFGVMVETERDVYPGALSVIKYNTFGTYPVECRMPALRFDDLKLGALGRRPENDDPSAPFVFNSDTRWSVQGLDDASEVIFSQWRNYNSPAHSWETIGDPDEVYANILYNNQALTGTIPGDKYQAWLNESFNDSSNNLIYNGDCSWSNHDVLAQIYDGASDVVALYLIRAYIPYVPAVLSLKETQTKRKAEVTEGKQVPGYVVLQAMKNASANQSDPSTGVETVTTDPATPAEYYNLQGQRVANPVAGEIYIIRRAGEVSKMIMH